MQERGYKNHTHMHQGQTFLHCSSIYAVITLNTQVAIATPEGPHWCMANRCQLMQVYSWLPM